jgi:hypothetical protein
MGQSSEADALQPHTTLRMLFVPLRCDVMRESTMTAVSSSPGGFLWSIEKHSDTQAHLAVYALEIDNGKRLGWPDALLLARNRFGRADEVTGREALRRWPFRSTGQALF